jgi:hypothetical protein
VDGSNIAMGCVLSLRDAKNLDHPIYFASRQLIVAKKNYTTTKKEALIVIFAIQIFCQFLLGYPLILYVDLDALKNSINKLDLSGYLAQ